MKKFIVPNRKKRKYIRKVKKQKVVSVKQNASLISRPTISFPAKQTIMTIGVMILLYSIWTTGNYLTFHMPSLPSMPNFTLPEVTMPTISFDWNKYITMCVNAIVTFTTTIATVLYSILIETIKGIIYVIDGIWHMVIVLWEWISWLVITVSNILFFFLGWLINSIIKLFIFILLIIVKTIQEILKLLGMAIISIWDMIQYMWQGITTFISHVLYIFGTPFRKLADFALVLQPYVDVFLRHVQNTFDELNNGYKNLIHIGDLLK